MNSQLILVGQLTMAMRFKGIIWIWFIISAAVQAAYVHQVVVLGTTDSALRTKLENTFSGQYLDDAFIEAVIRDIQTSGVFSQVSYTVHEIDKTTLSINMTPTPIIKRIEFKGLPMWDGRIRLGLKNKKNTHLNYRWLSDDIDYINRLLVEAGYFLATVRAATINNGVLIFDIASPKVASVSFLGLKNTKPWVVYRELVQKKGHPVTQHHLDMDGQTIGKMPYFSMVSSPIIHLISSENASIVYRVNERKFNRFDVGLEELENNQGVAIHSALMYHHGLIYSDILSLKFRLGYLNKIDFRSYEVDYKQPWLFNRYQFIGEAKVFMNYRTELMQNDVRSFDTQRQGVRLFLTKELRPLNLVVGSGIRSEHVLSSIASYQLNTLSFHLEHSKVRSTSNPKEGHRSQVIMDKGGRIFGAQLGGVDFLRLSASHSQFIPLFPTLTVACRLFAGGYHEYTSIPTFETERFSLGGGNSLRGYNEGAFYGNYRLSVNIEPRYQFNDKWIGALFLDAGFISDTLSTPYSSSFFMGYGLGVRWLTDILPLRLDLGFGQNNTMIHINVSQPF